METFASDLVQITDNFKEAYNELLICHQERDGLLKLAGKLDLIETDLNFIRSLLSQEKSALYDLKQNLAPISDFLNVATNKKRSVNFADKVTVTANPVAAPCATNSSNQQVNLLSEDEFEQLPKYLKGRLTATKINAFIQDFNRFLTEKYTLLLRSNPAKLSVDQRQKFFEWKAADLEELAGRCFLTEADFKAKNGTGHFKFDQVARNILTILRQVGRIKEVRSSDLNGTILHRLTHAFETKLFRNHPIVIANNLKPDITVHGSKIIFRPHAITFLTHVLKHFDVAVWTSSRPQNALPMVHYSFKNLLDFSSILEEANRRNVTVRQVILGPSDKGAELMKEKLLEDTMGKAKLKFIWTQSECDTVPADKENTEAAGSKDTADNSEIAEKDNSVNLTPSPLPSPSSKSLLFTKPIRKKDLSKIYATFPAYTPLNTLIIDDTDAKLIDHLDNHLCVPEFNITDHSTDFTLDKNLLQLKKYLDRLVKEDPEDVRTFLSKYDLEDA